MPSLIKEKKRVYKHRELREEVTKMKDNSTKSFTLFQLQSFIRLRNPEITAKELTGGKKKVEQLWKQEYASMPIQSIRWTRAQERLLDDLDNDRVGRFDETGLWKRSCEDRIAFLNIRLQSIPSNDALNIVKMVIEKNFETEREASRFVKSIFNKEESFSLGRAEDKLSNDDDRSYYSDAPGCSTHRRRSPDTSRKMSPNKIQFEVFNDGDGNIDGDGDGNSDGDEEGIECRCLSGEDEDKDDEEDSLSSSKYCRSSDSDGDSEGDASDLETEKLHFDVIISDDALEIAAFRTDGNDDSSDTEGNWEPDELSCAPDDDEILVLNDEPLNEDIYPYLDGSNVLFKFPMYGSDSHEFGTASKNISPELKYPRMIVQQRDIDKKWSENITTSEYKRVLDSDGWLNDVLIQFYARW